MKEGKNMSEKSLVDYAFDVISASSKEMKFKEIFDKVIVLAGFSDLDEAALKSKMSKLYTQLSLDGRFVTLKDNTWDLSDRHVFEERHIDMTDAYSDDYEGEDSDAADKEELELQNQELGVEDENDEAEESSDLDFDSQKQSSDEEEF